MHTPSAPEPEVTVGAGAAPSASAREAATAELNYRHQMEHRRRRTLDLLLASVFISALLLAAIVVWIDWQPGEPAHSIRVLQATIPWAIATVAAGFAAARLISTNAGSIVLLAASVGVISIASEPGQLGSISVLIAYSVPILAAGILLPPWSTFVVALLCCGAVAVSSVQAGNTLFPVPAIMIFFLLALITWHFASSLEASNRALSLANAALTNDIAERKRTEARLRLMSHIVEQSPVAIVLMSQEGRFEYVNPRFTELTGFSLDEVRSMGWENLQPPDVPPDVNEQILAHVAAGKRWRTQNRRMHKDGSWFWEEVSISVVHYADAGTLHYLAIAEDITARKQAEDTLRNLNAELERRVDARTAELQRANVDLQHSARLKDEFLATMSHELRTPLTGVLGAADVLGEQLHGALNAKQQESVRMIRESGKHLLTLINGILDLSKIEAGGMELNMDAADVNEVCSAALAVVRGEAQHKGLALRYSSTPALLTLMADSVRLKQILVNLLSNAIKFTPAGGEIGLDVTGDAPNEMVQFTVWDTGIGIAPEQQGRLFEPFVQIESGLDRHYGGAGLGLALVRKFTELHGGGVAVESSPGAGSRFTVTLPWRTAAAAETEAASAAPAAGDPLLAQVTTVLGRKPLILLAEDNRTSIEIVLNYLEPLGCEMLVVLRGDDAVRMTVERRPDVVLMDVQMPHLDGIAAMRRIRSHPDPQIAKTPLLALTALAMRGDRERCLAAGADDYLSKPFTLRALVEAIHRLIANA